MKKIIVPIDFSEYSEYALKVAAKLAKKNNSELLALHMLEMSDIMLTGAGEQPQKVIYFLKLAEQRFEDFLKKEYLEGLTITPIVKHFKVFSEVNEIAKKYEADLIVMGSHGASGAKEFFVGSNTERVVRNAEIPVLVVKNDIAKINFDIIAFACGFGEDSIEAYLKASSVFNRMNAKMYLVHVNLPNDRFQSSDEIEIDAVNFFTKADGNLDKMSDVHYISDYTVEDGILNAANKLGADLIVVPTHGRKGLAHFFQGSVGEDVANHAALPVMTFKI
ncbi:universal stress protein [Seonamhaeicola aphaedonensis]|uniref:Nucleotide-binding universal stress UspA family protein n=1 Tax=Seonamhaeicola aphaedonensis TaxID=1461338 RepID=A0A3D9H998_9FLAO|nr:universal stress protein [Seonamhaeicola aphaedonensis]RED46059.1 nucleotide-binding universal stress UspA family protein [Seonamhaeicola aphaedonensis]